MFSVVPADDSTSIDNEDIMYKQVVIDKVIYHVFEAEAVDENNVVVWEIGGRRYWLTSTLETDQLLEVAVSVK